MKPLIPISCLSLPVTEVFEELTVAVQEKDSLASELHVRHIAIEQLFKNCAKLPWLHISRAGVKASNSSSPVEWGVAAGRKLRHLNVVAASSEGEAQKAFMYTEWLLQHYGDAEC